MSKIVTFEQAKRLQALGISIVSDCGYVGYTKSGELVSRLKFKEDRGYQLIPSWIRVFTVSEALDFIREEKHIPCYVDAGYCHQYDTVGYWGVILSDFGYIKRVQTETSPTHPLAENALLDAVLTYLEQKDSK